MRLRTLLTRSIFATTLILVPAAAWAQVHRITPVIVNSSVQVEQGLRENKGSASTKLEGQGATLRITYVASEPLTVYTVPVNAAGQFAPHDFLTFMLPATEEGTVDIDLTVSPGWKPKTQTWVMHILTKENADAGFADVQFIRAGSASVALASVRHAFTVEPYSPSTYHGLRGYRVFGKDLTIIAGIILLVASGLTALIAAKGRRLQTVLVLLIGFQALYGLRFGIDLLRFSVEHTTGYAAGLYDEAGSVYRIAPVIRSLEATKVFVCRSGTSYKEKILRYFSYPVRVSADPKNVTDADAALVMNAYDWSFDGVTLRCDDLTLKTTKHSVFPDGSVLFTLTR